MTFDILIPTHKPPDDVACLVMNCRAAEPSARVVVCRDIEAGLDETTAPVLAIVPDTTRSIEKGLISELVAQLETTGHLTEGSGEVYVRLRDLGERTPDA